LNLRNKLKYRNKMYSSKSPPPPVSNPEETQETPSIKSRPMPRDSAIINLSPTNSTIEVQESFIEPIPQVLVAPVVEKEQPIAPTRIIQTPSFLENEQPIAPTRNIHTPSFAKQEEAVIPSQFLSPSPVVEQEQSAETPKRNVTPLLFAPRSSSLLSPESPKIASAPVVSNIIPIIPAESLCKVMLLGDSGVGKSSLFSQLTRNKFSAGIHSFV
jgi:hypothetical protein